MRKRGGIGEIVDGNQFQIGLFKNVLSGNTAYTTKTINGNADFFHMGVKVTGKFITSTKSE